MKELMSFFLRANICAEYKSITSYPMPREGSEEMLTRDDEKEI